VHLPSSWVGREGRVSGVGLRAAEIVTKNGVHGSLYIAQERSSCMRGRGWEKGGSAKESGLETHRGKSSGVWIRVGEDFYHSTKRKGLRPLRIHERRGREIH